MAKVEKSQKETIDAVTQEKKQRLYRSFSTLFDIITRGVQYHSRRANFFKKSNFILKSIDAFVGIGTLVAIGTQKTGEIFTSDNLLFSLSVAGSAVFLLYFGVLCDFSKKEETHRWLLSSYLSLNKEIDIYNRIDWYNLTNEEYAKYRDVYNGLQITIDGLRKEENPILIFLYLLVGLELRQAKGNAVPIFNKIKKTNLFLADYFSMPNYAIKIQNLEYEMCEEAEVGQSDNK